MVRFLHEREQARAHQAAQEAARKQAQELLPTGNRQG